MWLASGLIEFNAAQDEVGDTSKDNGQFKTNIHATRRIDQATNRTGNRSKIAIQDECLSKTKIGTYQSNHHGDDSGPTDRKSAARIPIIDIIVATTENKIL